MLRNTLFLPLMAAAIGGPMLFFAGSGDDSGDEKKEETAIEELSPDQLDQPTRKFYEPAGDLGQVFSFLMTPAQIETRWKDVTRTELNGYRIYRASLLTGHGKFDISGAITYRFDAEGRLKKISFTGFTADPRRLTDFLAAEFGFKPTDNAGMTMVSRPFSRYNGKLQLTRSTQWDGQVEIDLTISR